MAEDNTVMVVAVLAVIASLAAAGFSYYSAVGAGPKIVGFATSAGTANLSVEALVAVNFTDAVVDWKSGQVDVGQTSATLDTALGTVVQGNWTAETTGLVLENIGNVNVSINLKTVKDAATFLGGSSPAYKIQVSNVETDSCTGGDATLATWYDVNTTGMGTKFCGQFGFFNSYDALNVDVQLTVPYDSIKGYLSDTITATASAA